MAKKDWQKIWDKYQVDINKDNLYIRKEKNSLRWKEMEKILKENFETIDNLKTIEVGSGLGDFSLLLNKEGAKTTLADYSDEALSKARVRFKAHGCNAHYVLANMLDVPDKYRNKYDVSFSLGVAEHFENKDRFKIINAHGQVLKKGGLTFISVPYRYSFIYRLWMYRSIKKGDWPYGLEIPFSKKELKSLAEQSGFKTIGYIQSSFWSDLSNFFPKPIINKFVRNKKEKQSLLNRYGYVLVYVGIKK
jgi:ubiquinone/menaquinone biosynthesis C-methylase UbiE